jgi:hypothetical protein
MKIITSLAKELSDLKDEGNIKQIKFALEKRNRDLADIEKKNKDLSNQAWSLNARLDETQRVLKTTELLVQKVANGIMTYGSHADTCNYVDCVESGRLIDSEDKLCDCGWTTEKLGFKAVKTNIDNRL